MVSAVAVVGFAAPPFCRPARAVARRGQRPPPLPLRPRPASATSPWRHHTCPVAVTSVHGPPRPAPPPVAPVPATAPAVPGVEWRTADGAAAPDAAAVAPTDAAAAAADGGAKAVAPDGRAAPGLSVAYLWPRVLLLGVAAIWGTNFGTVKLIQTALPASAAAGVRFGLAAAALSPALLGARRRLSAGLWREGVVVGLWVFAGYATQSIALEGCHANTSAFLCSLAVAAVPLLTWLFPSLRPSNSSEPPSSLSTWLSAGLAIAGVACLELGAGAPITASDGFALFQAVAFGMGFILNERALAKYPDAALPISAIQLLVVAALSAAWALTDSATWSAAGGLHVLAPDLSPVFADATIGGALAYAGLITTAATVVAENVALVRVTAAEMAVLLATEPLWAALFSAALLGESMAPTAAGGGALILAACLVSTLLKGTGGHPKDG